MIRYLVKLLILCVIGFLVVWFGLPQFKKYAPRPYAQLASLLLGRPVAVEGTGEVADAGKAGELIGGALAKAGEAAGEAAAKAGLPTDAPSVADLFKNKKAATNETDAAVSPENLPNGERVEQPDGTVVVYVEEELPPDESKCGFFV